MEVENQRVENEEAADEVHNVQDLQLLERLHLDNDSDDEVFLLWSTALII